MLYRLRHALIALVAAAPAAADPQPGTGFRDCDHCPEMVVVPAGSFRMGSPSTEEAHSGDEGPVRTVTIAGAFAAGKYEVTRRQYAAFVAATGRPLPSECYVDETGDWELKTDRSWKDPGFEQGEDEPVVCVSWDDADTYVAWLSGETGERYRLLSEAEWEYVTRGGSDGPRYWGEDNSLACDFANVHDRTSKAQVGISWNPHPCDDGVARTAAAGRYRPNAFGLHDTLGNVFEWTADCWADDHPAGAPSDGSARTDGPCRNRVMRGGSWYYGPGFVRAAERTGVDTGSRIFDAGFRVAREIE